MAVQIDPDLIGAQDQPVASTRQIRFVCPVFSSRSGVWIIVDNLDVALARKR